MLSFILHLRQMVFLPPMTLVGPLISTLISFPTLEEVPSFTSHLVKSAIALLYITFNMLAFVPSILSFYRAFTMCMCVVCVMCMCGHTCHVTQVEVKGQFPRVCSLLPPFHGIQILSSGQHACIVTTFIF